MLPHKLKAKVVTLEDLAASDRTKKSKRPPPAAAPVVDEDADDELAGGRSGGGGGGGDHGRMRKPKKKSDKAPKTRRRNGGDEDAAANDGGSGDELPEGYVEMSIEQFRAIESADNGDDDDGGGGSGAAEDAAPPAPAPRGKKGAAAGGTDQLRWRPVPLSKVMLQSMGGGAGKNAGGIEGGFMMLEMAEGAKIIDGDKLMASLKEAKARKPPAPTKRGQPLAADSDGDDDDDDLGGGGTSEEEEGELIRTLAQQQHDEEAAAKLGSVTGKRKEASTDKAEQKSQKKKQQQQKRLRATDAAAADATTTTTTTTTTASAPAPVSLSETTGWAEFGLHRELLLALAALGFKQPTDIQRVAIPAALQRGNDVIGAAETGSGKTLAFGIPIVQGLLDAQQRRARSGDAAAGPRQLRALVLSPTRELAMQITKSLADLVKFTTLRVISLFGGMAPQKQQRLLGLGPEIVVATPGRLWELMSEGNPFLTDLTGLAYLVLDEADRMVETGHYEELDSIFKLLPEYSAAGRHGGGSSAPSAGDDGAAAGDADGDDDGGDDDGGDDGDADEDGGDDGDADEDAAGDDPADAAPLTVEMWTRPQTAYATQRRQTFLFSATLTMAPVLPERLKGKTHRKGFKLMSAIDRIRSRIHFQRTIEQIDLTSRVKTASTLEEAKIDCMAEEKDFYLYYFLERYKGKTIVFVNTIDCIRHLLPVLRILKLPVYPLHAEMQQRQRLKNLDRFRTDPNATLVATDVAARGLDIPAVQHVIHYQLPFTSELYVHRSGRTARIGSSGIAVMLVGPGDRQPFVKICKMLNKSDLPIFPIDGTFMPPIRKRMELAHRIDKAQHATVKAAKNKEWFVKTAKEADIDLDEEFLSSDDESGAKQVARTRAKQETAALQAQLRQLMQRPLVPESTARGSFIAVAAGLPELLQAQRQKELPGQDALEELKNRGERRKWRRGKAAV